VNVVALGVAAVLIAVNAYFVGAEFAVASVSRPRMEQVAGRSWAGRVVLAALTHTSTMLAATQLGITLASLGLGAVAEPALAHLLSDLGHGWLPAGAVHPVALVIALLLVSALHMVLGEMVPKNLALISPERAALWLVPPLAGFAWLTGPALNLLNRLSWGSLRLARITPVEELTTAYTAEDLPGVLAASREGRLLDEDEHVRASEALALRSRTVAAVLVPAAEVVTAPATATADDVERLVAETGHLRYPVLDDDGTPHGYVHALDALDKVRLRPLLSTSPDQTLATLLGQMRATRVHLAAVVDPDGRFAGIATLSDVLAGLLR
jgi:CBS domain containing-hemolysin-like protein